ncbi:uncharacterized protein FFB20_12392 [Fusarium fujikuroi]|nr:uncharacterized protein FFE2_00151 [Fusarium fujikuroi]SCN68834.1 uncharacterized protein FFC1_00148 [Fusarium fujikuroi]SCN71293.1 uncharacterized protein FFM5_00114 [Fusarium fujikuroi]SCO05803.1 uncharacterized protein FFB20_12392 [Fusarium fujikuroi]SCO28129.1 uncharacterized protein FFNC_00149 [Fusarium fujikuroi]
MQITSPSNSSS